jgi:hypothetical protein
MLSTDALLLRPCACCPMLPAICCYPLSHTLRFCCAFRIRLHSTLPPTRGNAATPATHTQPATATTPNERATTDPRLAAATRTSRASAETGTGSLFRGTHRRPPPSPYASSASGGTPTTSGAACARASGTDQQIRWQSAEARQQPSSSRTGDSCAWTGTSGARNAQPEATTTDTSARAAAATGTALRAAVEQRRHAPLTPLDAATWSDFLSRSGLLSRYPLVVPGISRGFFVGIRSITTNHTPPHTPSLLRDAAAFHAAADKELSSGRWIGPIPIALAIAELGPIHISPCSVINKKPDPEHPDAPPKKRLIQNFSSPTVPRAGVRSINDSIDIADYPCTWGSAKIMETLVCTLPDGCELAVRDVENAYRSIPLHESQWAGAVVRLDDEHVAIDTCGAFGQRAIGGVYGDVRDAGCDIMRWRGLGPICAWVDDHAFIRIPRAHLAGYNERRRAARQVVMDCSSAQPHHLRGCRWWEGTTHDDGSDDIYAEDLGFDVVDVSGSSTRSDHDASFAYNMADIDAVTDPLGIVWGASKTLPFAPANIYLGFLWNVQLRTVAVPPDKRARYLAALRVWCSSRTHTLREAQELLGRLQHICFVLPSGRAYLAWLQIFISLFDAKQDRHMGRTPPKRLSAELDWWEGQLRTNRLERQLRRPARVRDVRAYSDASSGIGIAVVIGDRWRAWRLLPGWQDEHRRIQWAEAVGFEFACRYVFADAPRDTHLRIWGDNNGVVQGWWRSRSSNIPTNELFKRLTLFLDERGCSAHTSYVKSACNPADDPSRGMYGDGTAYPLAQLLPPLALPADVAAHVVDFDDPVHQRERCQTYFPGDQLRATNRLRHLSQRIIRRNKLIISGTNQQSKARRRGRRMLNKSARDHRTVVYAFERRGASNAANRESSDVHRCSSPATMMLRKMLSFNISFLDRFPAPPTHTLRRNSSMETIVPGRHNTLRAALPLSDIHDRSVAPPRTAPAPPEQFLSEEELQELWSEVGHWTALRVIQPGGLNHKYVYSASRGSCED